MERHQSWIHNGLFMDQVRATADVFSCLFTSPAWIPHFRFITVLAPAAFPLDECRSVDKCLVPLTQICAPAWRAVLFIACRWQSDMEPWWLPDEQGTAESLGGFFFVLFFCLHLLVLLKEMMEMRSDKTETGATVKRDGQKKTLKNNKKQIWHMKKIFAMKFDCRRSRCTSGAIFNKSLVFWVLPVTCWDQERVESQGSLFTFSSWPGLGSWQCLTQGHSEWKLIFQNKKKASKSESEKIKCKPICGATHFVTRTKSRFLWSLCNYSLLRSSNVIWSFIQVDWHPNQDLFEKEKGGKALWCASLHPSDWNRCTVALTGQTPFHILTSD